MKQPQTIALTAVLAVVVGMVGFNGAFGDIFGLSNNPEVPTYEGQFLQGHIIVKHFDAEGNIISYQQTDNLVNDAAKNCGANLLFGTGFGSCTTPALFDFIAISTASAGFLETDTTLASECVAACGAGLDARQSGAVTQSILAASPAGAEVQIQATFTMGAAGPTTINSAGLFDASTGGNMFAERVFSSGVPLSLNDSLQVTWLITLD